LIEEEAVLAEEVTKFTLGVSPMFAEKDVSLVDFSP
jgi:hypothetical protein